MMGSPKVTDYSNTNQQNLIAVMSFLAGDYFIPKNVQDVADGLGLSRDIAFRTLWNLEKAGWVEQSGNGYRIAASFTKMAEAARHSLYKLFSEHLGGSQINKGDY